MSRTSFAATVRQDHKGFFDMGNGHETFESTKSTKPRRDADAQEAFVVRKGKHNKPVRAGRVDWDSAEDIRQRPDDARRGGAL